jgi:hypothetical protein
MARGSGFGFIIALLVGIAAATAFWLYGPYPPGQVARQVTQGLKEARLPVEVSKAADAELMAAAPQTQGGRFQVMAAGKNVFLADVQTGRVWRYYHHTREAGYGRDDEGFLPLGLLFGGKKYYTAREIDAKSE